MSRQIQQHENALSRGHWTMTNMGPSPSWSCSTGLAPGGAVVFNDSNWGGDESSSSGEVRAFAEDAVHLLLQWTMAAALLHLQLLPKGVLHSPVPGRAHECPSPQMRRGQ